MQTHFGRRARRVRRALVAGAGRLSRQYARPDHGEGRAGGPPTVEVVKVVEQPLNVTLSLPGELTPYQTVALYSRVTGFVKTIAVDRGSRVRAGEQLAVLEAPELVAQKAEAQSKLQSAEAQLAADPLESRGDREHLREVESGVRHAGCRRRQ